jgi:DNA processing protein
MRRKAMLGLRTDPTPHPTPLADADPVSALRLIRSRRVGAVTWHRLVAEHGSPRQALAELPAVARSAGVENYECCPEGVARAELAAGRKAGAVLLLHGGPGYPPALMEMPDAPPVLWALGDAGLLARPGVGMVGARNASSLGLRMARALAAALGAAGQVVVSGLARGIDAAAHEAALATGTIAVQAGGIDVIYPEENAGLHARIRDTGCLVSDQPWGLQPQARHFPLRNRIVAGLSRALIVVEAAAKSGSLLTAREAADLGREVMAVPGHPFDARAAGCNMLLRDGATLVRAAGDVMEALSLPHTGPARRPAPGTADLPLPEPAAPVRSLPETAALHREILARLGPSPVAEDVLIRDLSVSPAQVAPVLLTLEMDGRIERQAGGMLTRIR